MIYEIPLAFVVIMILLRASRLPTGRKVLASLVSVMSASIYVLCLWIPAHLQESGLVRGKLFRAGILAPPSQEDIGVLALRWALELALILLAEIMVTEFALMRPRVQKNVAQDAGSKTARLACTYLLAAGTIATLLFPAPALGDRAVGGQGLPTVLRGLLVVGLALTAYHNFFRNRWFLIGSSVGILVLILGSVRSPLLVVFFGYAAGLISRREMSVKRVVVVVSLAAALAFTASVMSGVRASVVRGLGVSANQVVKSTASNPFLAPYEAGLDTLDGYRVSERILPQERPRYFNALSVFTNFVPRALWPTKPVDLTVDISSRYLGYGASGQFLSPVGYLSLSFGGYPQALAALFILAALAAVFVQRTFGGPYLLVVIVVVFRFMIGGSAFDLYYGAVLALSLWLAQVVAKKQISFAASRTSTL